MDLEIQIGHFLEKIGQIGVWLQAIGLTGLDDAVDSECQRKSEPRACQKLSHCDHE